jgi:hypothetical protein
MYPLSHLTHQFGKNVIDKNSGLEVFDVQNSHALIQAAGYLKYNLAKNLNKGVFFRGQPKLYNTLSPTLYRDIRTSHALGVRRKLLSAFLETPDTDLPAVAPEYCEALLQHYGIRTTWLDVVDNIWIALWFACNNALTIGWPEGHLHFEKRIANNYSADEFAYILLISSAFFTPISKASPGYYQDKNSETIDLRVAVPSQFVRPHAQHGLLVRQLNSRNRPVNNFLPMHVGTIRVRLSSALDWLGAGATLTCHSLFPPAYYDVGYRELLERIRPTDKRLGSIYRIQA